MKIDDYDGQVSFFKKNKETALKALSHENAHFKELYNKILQKATAPKVRPKKEAVALALYLRACKYLFTAHNLTLEGHVEEARVLRRNVVELILLAYLINESNDVFLLWEECFNKRVKEVQYKGKVNTVNLKKKEYEISYLIKKYNLVLRQNPKINFLIRARGEFSNYFAHENIYNIVARVDNGIPETDGYIRLKIYIGQSAESENDRLRANVSSNYDLLKIIDGLF